MTTFRQTVILFLMSAAMIALFLPALAAGANPLEQQIVPAACAGKDAATACTVCHLGELARNILNFLIFFFVIFSSIVFAWAGVRYLVAGGNANAANIAKQTLLRVVGALVLVLLAWFIVNTVMSVLLGKGVSGALPWNQLC